MDSDLRNKFVDAAIQTYELDVFRNINFAEASRWMDQQLEASLALNDNETKNKRCEFFKINKSIPEDYTEKILAVDPFGSVVAGIRHIGGNPDEPFINIWPSFLIQSIDDLEQVKRAILPSFKVFKPKCLSFWLKPSSKIAQEVEAIITPSLRVVAGDIEDTCNSPVGDVHNVSLSRIKDQEYWQWYQNLYQVFHKEYPDLKPWVPVNDCETMTRSLEQELLFSIDIDHKRVGLIAAEYEGLLGLSGIYINEIVLDKDFKGYGYAKIAQRLFLEEMRGRANVVWGTIDTRNIASTKTALRVGRKPCRNEYFLPI